MGLTRREMACFERNPQFLDEVAAALMKKAALMKRQAVVVLANPESTAVEREFATQRARIAEQILAEQGINLQTPTGFPSGITATASGSTGMRYLVQQLLMSDGWTTTPDTWAANEMQARAAIETGMAALLDSLTEIPTI